MADTIFGSLDNFTVWLLTLSILRRRLLLTFNIYYSMKFVWQRRVSLATLDKKAVLSQRWPRNAPYIWVPWKFSRLPDYAHGTIPKFSCAFFRSTLWMFLQNLKSVALPVPEIIGGTQKIWAVPEYAHSPFSPKFLMGFYSDRPCKYTRQL